MKSRFEKLMKIIVQRLIKRNLITLAACGMSLFLLGLHLTTAEAQVQGEGWTPPFRLSTGQGDGSEATVLPDEYGFVHVFWREALENQRTLILYARYDGNTWTVPNDIYLSQEFAIIKNISAAISPDGRLYAIWTEGDGGPVYFTSAPVHNALSAKDWEKPYRVAIPASRVKLQIDSKGVLHVLYVRNIGEEKGVYYVHSEDKGITWSNPLWLDPDILPNHMPATLEFIMDEEGGFHASWFYFATDFSGGDWVRYIHSLDGGKTWSQPFTIDRLDESEVEAGEKLAFADPVLAVQGETVHIIWAGGLLNYRHHRYSDDRGRTWKPDVRVFGELNGQAGEGIAIDGAGRLHLLSQIRWPMAIYHMIWDKGRWTEPSLIYLIRFSSDVGPGDNIGAHNTYPAILAGNQLVLTFADPPSEPERRLFVMQYQIEDAPATSIEPTPTPTAAPTLEPTSTSESPTVTPMPSFGDGAPPATATPRPGNLLWIGVGPVLLLLAGITALRVILKFKK
jgi:hypothetical protein